MAKKVFGIKDKTTGEVVRIVKAETRKQVNDHILSRFDIEVLDAMSVAEALSGAENQLRVEDATLTPVLGNAEGTGDGAGDGAGGSGTSAPAAAPAASAGSDAPAASESEAQTVVVE